MIKRGQTKLTKPQFLIAGSLALTEEFISGKNTMLASENAHRFTGPFGLELYSLRRQIKGSDASSIRDAVAYARKIGYKELEIPELYGLPAAEFRKLLDEVGMPATGMIATFDEFKTDLATVIQIAHALKVSNVINAWIPHTGTFTLDLCRRTAKCYNDWGRKLRSAGLRFGHHTHGEEFQPYHGRPLFDILIQETNPDYVDFEMDIFWVVDAGQDPVAYLRQYPTRFRLVHLKDMRKGPPLANYTGNAPGELDVPLGTGRIDLPAILREAARVGVRRYYVEDESAEAYRNIINSLHYLQTVRL